MSLLFTFDQNPSAELFLSWERLPSRPALCFNLSSLVFRHLADMKVFVLSSSF